jgi:hypothetical protein
LEGTVPQIEALYVVEFGDIGSSAQAMRNGGVAVLETNRIFGGDSGYYYVGRYTIRDNQIDATVRVVKHNPNFANVFGDTAQSFDARLQGSVTDGVMNGHIERLDRPGTRLPVRLTRKENLP